MAKRATILCVARTHLTTRRGQLSICFGIINKNRFCSLKVARTYLGSLSDLTESTPSDESKHNEDGTMKGMEEVPEKPTQYTGFSSGSSSALPSVSPPTKSLSEILATSSSDDEEEEGEISEDSTTLADRAKVFR